MKKGIFGILLIMEGFFLLLTFLVTLFCNEGDGYAFLGASGLCIGVGTFFKWRGEKKKDIRMSRADSFMVVSLSWVVFSLFGMIPFLLLTPMDVSSAFFETISGFTTTGASCISDIDGLSHGLKFWRSIIQWMGGLGIVVFSFALIPSYEMRNANVFSAEVTGLGLDKLTPRIGSTARKLLMVYILLTLFCALCYWFGPMCFFDAVCHAMSTVATGGFSTHTQSIAYFHSSYIEYVCSLFMIASGLNFGIYYYLYIGKGRLVFRNEELRVYLYIVVIAVALFTVMMMCTGAYNPSLPQGLEESFRSSLFHVASICTSTGYAAQKFDYVSWGVPYWVPTVLLMAMGACAGSTAGGIKIIRVIVSAKSALNEFIRQLHPRAILSLRISGQTVPYEHIRRAITFILIYIVLVFFGTFLLTLMGMDIDTSLGSCVSMLSNVGPGTGATGPASNFSVVPALGKWLMSLYMLVGRLEIFTVLFLLLPGYWKQQK